MTAKTVRSSWIEQEILWCIAIPLLMLLNGFVTAHISGDVGKDQGSEEHGLPAITVPAGTTVNAELGKSLELTCRAVTGYSDTFSTIIYWLANHQFIEDMFEDGRVKEGKERFLTKNRKTLIQKNLKFTKVTPEDFKTNFTCAVMNPTGSSIKNIILVEKVVSLSRTGPCRRKLLRCKQRLEACLQTNNHLEKEASSTDDVALQVSILETC
ncbi:interleukin-1 receptor type 2-like [Heterodontus francisci]|uniref:interleukin-1 receptor type 2-like n=1 Tax=Heterodontus francisci TaxID=7792 RepID=UPI00355C5696